MICMEVDGMKRVLFKVILPLAFIVVWLNMCYWICLGENGVNWFQFWIMSGFPFGIQKMLVLLIPRNFGIAGSIGVLALDAVIGGMIGVIVLAIKIIAIIREVINIIMELAGKRISAYFITSGHSVQKWKGTDMESMRDTKRIMEREIKKGSTPLSFEQMEIDTNNYQEITSVEKLTQVLQYLHRVGNYKSLAGKTVINNVYTFMRGRTPDFTRARSIFDREKIYHQMLRQERKMKPTYEGDCYIETAKCYFSLPEEWEKHKMIYLNNDAYGFILSNKYILGLYKYCREARRDIAMEAHEIPENTNTVVQRLINMENLEVLSHCLLLDDVWIEDNLIGAKMYTIFKLGISSQSTAFLL